MEDLRKFMSSWKFKISIEIFHETERMELLYNFTLIVFLIIFHTEAQIGPSKKL